MPLAIQYGMTPSQFWNSTESEFEAYQKAYINDMHEKAWLNNAYLSIAMQDCLYNSYIK